MHKFISNHMLIIAAVTNFLFMGCGEDNPIKLPGKVIGSVDRGLNAVDTAINEIKQGNKTLEDVKNILAGTKDKLDRGEYKQQIDDLVGRVSQVAQLGVQGSVDFTRNRAIEDLQSIKRSLLGQPQLPKVPILSNPQSPTIDYSSASRSALTVVGWNLDVAQKDRVKYKIAIKNEKEADRGVDWGNVTYQGQYSVTINIGRNGIPFHPNDKKLIFLGFDPVFELGVINSDPPPPPEKIVSVSGTIRTTNQDREGGFCRLELRDGEAVVWSHGFPEYPTWKDNYSEQFALDKLDKLRPSNPRLLVFLSQQGARERNILWRFEARAEFRTDRGNTIRFDQVGLELHCGDGRPAEVSTPLNMIR